MNWNQYLCCENEKPLDRLVEGYSNTSVFRTIAFVGDSLSSGEFQIKKADGTWGFYDLYEYSWGQYLARKNGLTAYNFSKGGMTAKQYLESFAEKKGFWNPELKAQAYVIALGVNDVLNSAMEIGSVSDVDVSDYRNNKPTFLGYYATIVSRYKEISPDAKFFFVTIPNDDYPERSDRERKIAALKEIADKLHDLAKLFDNTYVIDLYRYAPAFDNKFREKFFLHGHMNPSGYIFFASLVDSYIDYIIRHNPEDFRTVGLINSGISYPKE